MFTDRLFTGQREMAGLGIYQFGARFYSPKMGRFLSADSIVPQPFNPQSLNRYTYALNNPIRYNDPTGHWIDEGCGTGGGGVQGVTCQEQMEVLEAAGEMAVEPVRMVEEF